MLGDVGIPDLPNGLPSLAQLEEEKKIVHLLHFSEFRICQCYGMTSASPQACIFLALPRFEASELRSYVTMSSTVTIIHQSYLNLCFRPYTSIFVNSVLRCTQSVCYVMNFTASASSNLPLPCLASSWFSRENCLSYINGNN